jgi:hypothetical protein
MSVHSSNKSKRPWVRDWSNLAAMVALWSLALGAVDGFAAGKLPYLLTFPAISVDSSGVYFKGEVWTAVWRRDIGHPACVPTSLVEVPQPEDGRTVYYGGDFFAVSGDTLWWRKGIVTRSTYVLPDPTRGELQELRKAGDIDPGALLVLEEKMGPIVRAHGRLWFGLVLLDELSRTAISGIGWFDLKTEKFVRIYSAEIGPYRPRRITTFRDSILVLYASESEKGVASRTYLYETNSGHFSEMNLQAEGIAGDSVLDIVRQGDSLLFSTDHGISLWRLGRRVLNYATLAVASRAPVGLSVRIFDATLRGEFREVPFDTLPPGVSTRIWWEQGDWYEVAVPHPVEGFVSSDAWNEYGHVWQSHLWDCAEEPCFARVEIPMRGQNQPADFLHTPLTYLGSTPDGVKVGIDAAWVRIDEVVPILVETQSVR